MRFFNTAGPNRPDIHYNLPPLGRWDLDEVLSLVQQEKYFVLHAPRQTGKTTCLLALMKYLNEHGQYRALYSNIEAAQAVREDVAQGMSTIVYTLAASAHDLLGEASALDLVQTVRSAVPPAAMLASYLSRWSEECQKPTVLMIDEVDALVGDTLISLLRQLRAGYNQRPGAFPQSVILCGVRDVRDYRIHSSAETAVITGGSVFNIWAKSLRLGDFSREDMERLYAEHTEATGQIFELDALDLSWDLSCGQPWVVNALAYETCFRMKEGRDRSRAITAEMVGQAGENLILRRETHLDQLADKLKEDRVRRVVEPLIAGEDLGQRASEEDIQYVVDLGLIRRGDSGLEVANALYREVVPRQLTFVSEIAFESKVQRAWYVRPDGLLDMEKLVTGFQEFFRENSEHWSQRFEYQEAWPQLLLQAFLQRIVNGGGRIQREYGLGRGRVDLLVVWRSQRIVLELKVLHKTLERTITEGVEQTAAYMDRCGTAEGNLVIFDRDSSKTWDEKIFRRDMTINSRTITVWGM